MPPSLSLSYVKTEKIQRKCSSKAELYRTDWMTLKCTFSGVIVSLQWRRSWDVQILLIELQNCPTYQSYHWLNVNFCRLYFCSLLVTRCPIRTRYWALHYALNHAWCAFRYHSIQSIFSRRQSENNIIEMFQSLIKKS